MITTKDLYDIIENKISNETQKSLIRNSFPPQIADRMCNAIDCQEEAEHLLTFLGKALFFPLLYPELPNKYLLFPAFCLAHLTFSK